ncbi:outer membrane beta-barrel protein [Caulobacter soli]|uniref:outer membrane beta-barrel protein n=1 Tax=Caulobacter soli TaxID=2708539 RepID=UPI0013E9E0B3|nr:outer membrane beta-barrel protein [Caulobacter soli]
MKLLATAALAAAFSVSMPLVVSAQDLGSNFKRDKSVSVRQRPRPDFEAIGIKAGGFTVFPRVTLSATHDDNIYATATDEQSDTIWRVKPEVAVRSNWSRNALGAFASATINRYSDFDTENTEEYTIGANGRLDLERGSNIAGSLQYQALTEPRTSPTSPVAATAPVEYTLVTGNLTAIKEFNRLRLTGRLDNKTYDYDDARNAAGGVIDQDTRDRDEFYYGGKAEYAVSPDTAVFFSLVGNKKDYDLAIAGRDSDGYVVSGGVNFEISQVARGEIEGGYMDQSYDNPAYANVSGFNAKGRVEWFPTELTTVTLNGSRTIEEAVAAGSQGYISNNLSAGVDHELLRNVLLSAQASYGKDNYQTIDRDDKRTGFNASATYLMNRNVGLILAYTFLKQNSSGGARGASFDDNKIAASVAFQF